MANTSKVHKEKKSQKRKDRQQRRAEKQKEKAKKNLKIQTVFQPSCQLKGLEKSLPAFLAKNKDTICRWLKDYCILFMKADDAYIDYFRYMDKEKRNELLEDYANIRDFIDVVQHFEELKQKIAEDQNENKENL